MKKDINKTFSSRKEGIECPMCLDSSEDDLVIELPSGRLHLQNDADYLGYCILIYRRHAVELHDLAEQERIQWIEDIARTGKALTEICRPDKLNLSMLGNMVPHLHCHIMPRYLEEADWGHPPQYRRPADRRPLEPDAYQNLRLALKHALE